MSANKGPARSDFKDSRAPGCTCEACAERHGDQAPSAEDVVIASLQREVADLKKERAECVLTVHAQRMVAAEREACAKVASDRAEQIKHDPSFFGLGDPCREAVAEWIAGVIRARGGA